MAEALSPLAGSLGTVRASAIARGLDVATTIARLIGEARAARSASPLEVARRAQRTARRILAIHGVEVRTTGEMPAGAGLLVANHLGYLDPLVVAAALPCIAIAKGEAEEWALVGRGLRALGVVFVRRADPHSGAVALRRSWRILRAGAAVLNFPEGTTTDGRQIGAFRRGSFGLARLARVPIVPLRLSYDEERVAWYGGKTFLPHYWELARIPRIVASVSFGAPLLAAPAERATDLAARARQAISCLRPAD